MIGRRGRGKQPPDSGRGATAPQPGVWRRSRRAFAEGRDAIVESAEALTRRRDEIAAEREEIIRLREDALIDRERAADPRVSEVVEAPEAPDDSSGGPPAVHVTVRQPPQRGIPAWLQVTAGWGWRLLVLAAVIALIWLVGSYIGVVVVPLLVATLAAAALWSTTEFLANRGRFPRWLAALTSIVLLLVVIVGLLTVVGGQISMQWRGLVDQATTGFTGLVNWLGTGPLGIDQTQIDSWFAQITQLAQEQQERIASTLAAAGSGVANAVTGTVLTVFATFFYLKDGHRLSQIGRGLVPLRAHDMMLTAGAGAWKSLTSYMRATVTVAAVDGIGAGIGAAILGSNLWAAIAMLTFVFAFIPIIGAGVAGTVAVVVVLVTLGPIKALIMLGIFVAVMSLESNLLQPLLLGRAVSLHPLMVLLSISVGVIVAGVAGALLAVPLVAVLTGASNALWERGVIPQRRASRTDGSEGEGPPEHTADPTAADSPQEAAARVATPEGLDDDDDLPERRVSEGPRRGHADARPRPQGPDGETARRPSDDEAARVRPQDEAERLRPDLGPDLGPRP